MTDDPRIPDPGDPGDVEHDGALGDDRVHGTDAHAADHAADHIGDVAADLDALAVSAVADGTADEAERARVEASVELRRRVEASRRASASMRDVTVPAAARESAISAALAAFDDMHSTAPGRTAPVVAITSRSRRRWTSRSSLAAAAAVVAVLAVGGVVVQTLGGSDDDSAATEATASSGAKQGDDGNTSVGGGEPEFVTSAAAAPTIGEIDGPGDVPDDGEDAAAEMAAADAAPAPAAPAETTEAADASPLLDPADSATAGDAGDDLDAADTTLATSEQPGASAPPPASTPASVAAETTAVTRFGITERVADEDALIAYVERVDALDPDSTTTTVPQDLQSCTIRSAASDVLGAVLFGPDEVPVLVLRRHDDGALLGETIGTCEVIVTVLR